MEGYCEVCGAWCPSLDLHHAIPREYGGEKSKLIRLRPDIHQTIHRCVDNPKLEDAFLAGLPVSGRKLASDLIALIRAARQASSNHEALAHKVILQVDDDLWQKLLIIRDELHMQSVSAVILSILQKVVK